MTAAFVIIAALREPDGSPGRPAGGRGPDDPGRGPTPGSGQGQMVDVSMADGALSWLAMVAGAYFADAPVPHRRELPLAGPLVCYRPHARAARWGSLGAL